MNNNVTIVGIGPALVDFTIEVCPNNFDGLVHDRGIEIGGWYNVSSIRLMRDKIFRITDVDVYDIQAVQQLHFTAGSTVLGVFSAFSKELRSNSCILTPKGDSNNYISKESFKIFSKTVENLGISHAICSTSGLNPIGVVVTSTDNPERTLFTYKGCTSNAEFFELSVNSEYIYVDAYELKKGRFALSIDRLIRSKKYKVFIGLSNVNILNGKLRNALLEYIKNGMLYGIVGNENEYNILLDNYYISPKESINILTDYVPYQLLTMGAFGMFGRFRNEVIFQDAYKCPAEAIVSTSGAGDISAGVFIDGIINKVNYENIMNKASLSASKKLMQLSNVLSHGIEYLLN